MKRVFLVSCVGLKRTEPTKARDLYYSPWFIKARGYVESTDAPWYILSAKYGLVSPDQIIAPYNETLAGLRATQRRHWAQNILSQLTLTLTPNQSVIILAGEHYREFLIPTLVSRGISVSVPMKHLGIGEQLRWLAANTLTTQEEKQKT